MTTLLETSVPARAGELPIEKYIARAYPMLGMNRIRKLIADRDVRVNGTRAQSGVSVSAGDELKIYLSQAPDFSLEILFDEDGVLALYKPDGLPVDVDTDGIGEDTVLSRLKRLYPDACLVHRLDTYTSGVMLAAKDKDTAEQLEKMFREHLFIKHYHALVLGNMPQRKGELCAYLVKDAKSAQVRVSDKNSPGALEIQTNYTVMSQEQLSGYTVSKLLVEIPTGRTHQIRAHLAHISHPLVGDDKYGNRQANKALSARTPRLECCEIRVKDNEILPFLSGKRLELPKPEKR